MDVAVMHRRPIRYDKVLALVLLVAGLLGIGFAMPAYAGVAGLIDPACHAVTSVMAAADAPEPRFTCSGKPKNYQQSSLSPVKNAESRRNALVLAGLK